MNYVDLNNLDAINLFKSTYNNLIGSYIKEIHIYPYYNDNDEYISLTLVQNGIEIELVFYDLIDYRIIYDSVNETYDINFSFTNDTIDFYLYDNDEPIVIKAKKIKYRTIS